MTLDQNLDLLTVAEAASILRVSTVTLHRWLKEGRLPAFYVGPRGIRIRREDLAIVMTPVQRTTARSMTEGHPEHKHAVHAEIEPMTDEDVAARRAALVAAAELRQRMLDRRGGQPLAESWPLIREAREERASRI